jgi:hypothetical protein
MPRADLRTDGFFIRAQAAIRADGFSSAQNRRSTRKPPLRNATMLTQSSRADAFTTSRR